VREQEPATLADEVTTDPPAAAADRAIARGELYPQYEHEFIGELEGDADEFDLLREQVLIGYGYQTARAYWGDLEHWRDWCLSYRRPLDPILATPFQVRRYLQWLEHADYSPNTRARRLTALRKLFQQAVADGELEIDPTEGMTAPPRRK
jgi:Phage integrase, N-terminal SAM-like domain